jgi:hypothetical protein
MAVSAFSGRVFLFFGKQILKWRGAGPLFYKWHNCHFNILDNFAPCKTRDHDPIPFFLGPRLFNMWAYGGR